MCNRFLAFLAREDQEEQLTFEPLPDDDPKTSMIVRHDSRGTGVSPVEKTPPTAPPGETPGFLACNLTRESNAVLVILESLGGHWRALAILGRLIPRPIRDFLYRIVAKNRHRFGSRKACALPSAAVRKRLVKSLVSVSAIVLVLSLTSCLVTERPPGGNHLGKPDAAFSEVTSSDPALIQTGDVIAFHMPRKEAWAHLKKGKIQKIPYQLFDYGHLALVVDHPDEPRLLQLAMKQAANIDSGLDYLDDKQWTVFRPTTEIDKDRLKEFVEVSLSRLDDPKEAYDFSGVIGFHNRTTTPDKPEEIAKEYTCVTLIQAALHYAGHRTRSIHRKGFLDIVTPAQFIESGNEKH
jgi:predicted DCC family thiol-disulfide oxidoreductase YuxK